MLAPAFGAAAIGAFGVGALADWRGSVMSRQPFPNASRNVADGAKNKFPVTARLKSSRRS
jgi:hypothetical protein